MTKNYHRYLRDTKTAIDTLVLVKSKHSYHLSSKKRLNRKGMNYSKGDMIYLNQIVHNTFSHNAHRNSRLNKQATSFS